MSTSVDTSSAEPAGRSRLRRFFTNQQFVLFIVLVALILFFASRNSLFFRVGEFSNLFTDFSGLVLIALAETYVITAGGIDLAVGSTAAVSGVVAAGWIQPLVNHGVNQAVVLLVGTVACAFVGALAGGVSALLITAFDLVPFVATLVTYSVGAGLALVISHGAPVGYNPGAIYWSASGFGMITWLVAIVLVVAVVLGVVLHLTVYGRYNFAIGSNEFAARAAGIAVRRHLVSVYVLAGVLAGLTGMFFYIRSGSGAATTGVTNSANLVAIAAVVIGGASLTGGVGRWAGTMLGAAVLTVVSDGLIFINVPPTWIQVVVGALIALAALLQSFPPSIQEDDVTTVDEREPVLELRHITLHYGSVEALHDVSIKSYAGEVIGLVGDNGAGKSSLIKVISGVNTADSGEVIVDGVLRHWRSPHDSMAAGIETLYQDSGLAPDLSIGSNIFLGREKRRRGILGRLGFVDQRAMEREALEQLARVGITIPATQRTVSELSGGQRQAVAIGRAIAWAQHVIILDEPTNHLGARQSAEVLKVIKSAREQGLSVLFISHSLPHVLEVTDRIIVLRLGRVVRDAPTSEFTVESLLGTITGLNESAPS